MLFLLAFLGRVSAQSTDLGARELLTLEQCDCDLVLNSCDANCCCDDVCTDDDMARFSGCQRTVASPSLDYCIPEDRVAEV